jgi:hypothetical protein
MTTNQKTANRLSSSRYGENSRQRTNVKNALTGNLIARKEKFIIKTKKRSSLPDMAYEDMLNCCD